MGNDSNLSIHNGPLQLKKWTIVREQSIISGNPILIQQQDQQLMLHEYLIQLKKQASLQSQMQIYKDRASSCSGNLVNIFSAQLVDQVNKKAKIKTQVINWRLNDKRNLTINEGYYLLENALRGYSQLHINLKKPFLICDNMIGINQFGRVKVWINSNYAKNELGYPNISIKSQRQMIYELLLSVQKHLQDKMFPIAFKRQTHRLQDFNSFYAVVKKYFNYDPNKKLDIGKRLLTKDKFEINKNKNSLTDSNRLDYLTSQNRDYITPGKKRKQILYTETEQHLSKKQQQFNELKNDRYKISKLIQSRTNTIKDQQYNNRPKYFAIHNPQQQKTRLIKSPNYNQKNRQKIYSDYTGIKKQQKNRILQKQYNQYNKQFNVHSTINLPINNEKQLNNINMTNFATKILQLQQKYKILEKTLESLQSTKLKQVRISKQINNQKVKTPYPSSIRTHQYKKQYKQQKTYQYQKDNMQKHFSSQKKYPYQYRNNKQKLRQQPRNIYPETYQPSYNNRPSSSRQKPISTNFLKSGQNKRY